MAMDQDIPRRSGLAGSLSLVAIAVVLILAGLAAAFVIGDASLETLARSALQVLGLAAIAAVVCVAITGLMRLGRR